MVIARNPFQLPERMAVFPLSGVVLMPFGHLPLHIFEPRYLNMIDDTLGGSRIIALAQPRLPFDNPVPSDAALYDIGTAGRIISFADPGNGRYHITLEGLARFRIQSVIEPDAARGYRSVVADFSAFQDDLQPTQLEDGPERARILALLREYFSDKEIDADWDSVSEAPYEALISSLVMTCPFEPGEKQALLECKNHFERARMLVSLFEVSIENPVTPSGFKH